MPRNINGAKIYVWLYSEYLCSLLKKDFLTNISKIVFFEWKWKNITLFSSFTFVHRNQLTSLCSLQSRKLFALLPIMYLMYVAHYLRSSSYGWMQTELHSYSTLSAMSPFWDRSNSAASEKWHMPAKGLYKRAQKFTHMGTLILDHRAGSYPESSEYN